MLLAVAALSAGANPSESSGGRERELSPRYTITIPAAGATRVHVHVELDAVATPTLKVGFRHRSGPGQKATVHAYRINPTARRRGGAALSTRYRGSGKDNLSVFEVRDVRGNVALGKVDLDYDLDLTAALGVSQDPGGLARVYQDRMVVTNRFATLRGDTLCIPLGATIVNPQVRIVGPVGWQTALNAERPGDSFVFRARYPASTAAEAWRWFGLCGVGLVTETRSTGSMRWTLTLAPTPDDAGSVARTAWDCVQHYSRTFGLDPLEHLEQPPPLGIGRKELHLFAVPYPPGIQHGRGGQYLPGTAYFFYAPGCPDSLGHVVAHEYLHAYNGRALHRGGPGGGVSWFREAYTDVQATLVSLGLSEASDATRRNRLQMAIAEAWAVSEGRDPGALMTKLGLATATKGEGQHRGGSAISSFAAGYDRQVARETVAVFGLALLLERTRPGRAGLDAWLRVLLRDHAQGASMSEEVVKRACMEAAGTSGSLEGYYRRHIEYWRKVPLETLRGWIESDELRSLCPRIRRPWAAGSLPTARNSTNRTIDPVPPAVSSQ